VSLLEMGEGNLLIAGKELGHDGDLRRGVNGSSFSEEGLVSHSERVEIASIFVADTIISLVIVTAVSSLASSLSRA